MNIKPRLRTSEGLIEFEAQAPGDRLYSERDVRSLVSAVGDFPQAQIKSFRIRNKLQRAVFVSRSDELAHLMEQAAYVFHTERQWQATPALSDTMKRLKVVHSAAKKLYKTLRKSVTSKHAEYRAVTTALQNHLNEWAEKHNGFPEAFPDLVPEREGSYSNFSSDIALCRCIRVSELIVSASSDAIRRRRHQIAKGRTGKYARNVGDQAMANFVHNIASIYKHLWDKEPGISRSWSHNKAGGPFIRFAIAALCPLGINVTGESIAGYLRNRIGKSTPRNS